MGPLIITMKINFIEDVRLKHRELQMSCKEKRGLGNEKRVTVGYGDGFGPTIGS